MGNSRGFRIRQKLVKVFNWSVHRRPIENLYERKRTYFRHRFRCTAKAVSKICDLGRGLKRGAKELCFFKSDPGYVRVGDEEKPDCTVPKGHLAVYVGEKEEDGSSRVRVLVPVIFFNHPLFGNLLREAEKVYGYNHSGGIQIPCRISEFENVQTKIIQCSKSRLSGSSKSRIGARLSDDV